MRIPVLGTFLLASAVLLSGCNQAARNAPGGGPAVSALPAPAAPAGALQGTLIATIQNGEIGPSIDQSDKEAAYQAEWVALQSGTPGVPVPWRGGNPGHSGQVTPGPLYKVNQYECRDYAQTVTIDGRSASARGTACREPDGSWRPVA